jgi:hypothetical protein
MSQSLFSGLSVYHSIALVGAGAMAVLAMDLDPDGRLRACRRRWGRGGEYTRRASTELAKLWCHIPPIPESVNHHHVCRLGKKQHRL